MRFFDLLGEGVSTPITRLGHMVLGVLGVFMTLYLGWYALFASVDAHFMATIVFAGLVPLAFLTKSFSVAFPNRTWIDWALAALSLAVGLYYVLNADFYKEVVVGLTPISMTEQIAAVLVAILCFEACRRCVGLGLSSIMLVFVLYVAFGHLLPPPLHHEPIGLEYFTLMQTVTVTGIFGVNIEVVGSYVFLFILFGGLYHRSGGGALFFELAAALTGRSRGGGAKACVISSGLYGSISGSPVADVVTTGPLTVPLMLKSGVSPVRAGAIEAAASSGGAMLPPVMGAVAFLMVEYAGVPYGQIVASAWISALLYYFGILLFVHLSAVYNGEGQIELAKVQGLKAALIDNWPSLVPVVAMLVLLHQGYSVPYVAAGSTLALILSSYFSRNRQWWITPKALIESCGETLLRLSPMVAAVLVAGFITGAIELTGLSGKFSLLLKMLAGDSAILALMVSGVVLILFGMGMPTPGVYILGAALLAPVLTTTYKFGLFETHLFIVFYSCMSAITPPVAVACFAAATISGGNPMRIGVEACRIAIVGFVIPIYFLFHPGILLRGSTSTIVADTALAIVMCSALIYATQGTTMGRIIPIYVRLGLLVLAGVMTVAGPLYAAGAAVAFLVWFGITWLMYRGTEPAIGAPAGKLAEQK